MIGNPFRKAGSRQLGNRARDAGRWAEAANHFSRHLDVEPNDFAIWVQLGHMRTQLADFVAADAAYARAAELRPDDSDLLLCWGRSRKLAGDVDQAHLLFQRSAASDGNLHAVNELVQMQVPEPSAEARDVQTHDPEPAPESEPVYTPPPPRPAWMARIELVKPFRMTGGEEVALFVTHSATGALKPHVLPYLKALAAENVRILLIAVTDRELHITDAVIDLAAGVIVRENAGYDFAAWAHILHLHPELYGAGTLYLLNDSLIGPSSQAGFHALLARVRDSGADLLGLTESHEYRWHLQSFFLAIKPRLLSGWPLQNFFAHVQVLPDKDAVIRAYEVIFAPAMQHSGYRVETLFSSPFPLNPALLDWRRLIAAGMPFVKVLLLRGHFAEIDVSGWRETLGEAGFDLDMIDATLAIGALTVPSEPTGALFAHPLRFDPAEGRALKVAFYGPWNYDNGLGAAARGTVAALQRTGARVNLHPIKVPFHVHKPLTPPVDVIDFMGDADIAVIHLNPDSWFLLTGEQRAAISRARHRVGYWVWEMDHIPDAWRADFASVDRIWAPSQYCADVFARHAGVPVDVIPHAVPLPPPGMVDRAALLTELDLPSDRRIILYVFDGSSYLVRKNPAALIRAFSASKLADAGWTLVLKTKHLMDRPEEGAALRALAEATSHVALIDRSLTADVLERLFAVADIYASPHCSEGFGLTIAEAMAAGKPVVATDFGGSVDHLDAAVGYPVKARRWRLDQDFGHYQAGGEWARIDEPALTMALRQSASDVAQGKVEIGGAARERIGQRLSYAAVGHAMANSLRDTMRGIGGGRVARLSVRLQRGIPVEQANFAPHLGVSILAADGSIAPNEPRAIEGGWILFAPAGSVLAPNVLDLVAHYAGQRPDAAIFYGDDVAAYTTHAIDQVRLKPEFDRTLLIAQDYVGAPLIIRAAALEQIGTLDPAHGTAAVADLLFRANAAGLSIARIPHVLLAHPGERIAARPDDYARMLRAQPGLGEAIVPGRTPNSFALQHAFVGETAPAVTIVVPTCRSTLPGGEGTYVERLLTEISRTDWPMDRLTVIIGDDGEDTPAWALAKWPFTLQHIVTARAPDEPFNYAAKMNRLWRAAETEHLVLMNDDCKPLATHWLKALMSFAIDSSVGGVGARLLYDDGRLQHAGLAPHGPAAAHVWLFRPDSDGTYQDWALVQREWSMVTGAVFATRRSVMEQADGFEERFSLEFNDTDLCLRLRTMGYRIVCTPMAEMIHSEKASRGQRLPPGDEVALFLSRWRGWLDNDPAWHPWLRRDCFEMTPGIDTQAWYL